MGVGLLLLLLTGTGCSGLVKTTDATIPRLVTPIVSATYDELTGRLAPFCELKSLRAWKASLRFDDLESAERYRQAEALVAVSRPDRIRLVIEIPMVKSRIAEMVSENNHFKVAIYLTAPTTANGANGLVNGGGARWSRRAHFTLPTRC
ncbi:MAG: hypothetical protein EBZ36_11520 [Acidobacteria bacterium]|nr:hypothetical protein [Acidobacteriota bacterium]